MAKSSPSPAAPATAAPRGRRSQVSDSEPPQGAFAARDRALALDALDAGRAGEDPQASSLSLGNLWQMPLLLVSLGLFTLAAYLFIDPQPAPAVQTQLARAMREVEAERFDAAIGRLNDLLATKPEPRQEIGARLLLAEALDLQMRRNRSAETPQAHRRIVAEIKAAYAAGSAPTSDTSDRLARSLEALGEVDEASEHYTRATGLLEHAEMAERGVPMRRSAIEMLIAHGRAAAATDALKAFLEVTGLSDDERAWALGELARISIDADRPSEAMGFLAAAQALSPDEAVRGQVSFRYGYAAWKLGQNAEAAEHLTLAREQLGPGHHLDAEACLLLGKLAQAREAPAEADAFYEIVLRDHPQSRSAPAARLGRGFVRIVLGHDAEGVGDLITLAEELARKPALAPLRPELADALRRASRIIAGRGNYEAALELLAREQAIEPEPDSDFFARLGLYFEKLADQIEQTVADAEEPDRPTLQNRVNALRTRAGDAYLACSRRLTLIDDEGYGAALWKGIELYEQAGHLGQSIAALELFCDERPGDPLAPAALFRLGRTYQAVGRQEKAVDTLLRLRGQYPQALAAAEAAVPLAQAYVAQGPDKYPEAEGVLRSVTDDNPLLDSQSQTFRLAVWELGHLHLRMGRFGEALGRFEEYASRYAEPERAGELAFLRGECYRLAAAQRTRGTGRPADPLSPGATSDGPAQLAASSPDAGDEETRQYLERARALFDRALEHYRQSPPAAELEREYERLAYFYRADCMFDLGAFEEAIRLYDAAAYRYQDDPASIAAYMQIVNAYVALGRAADARAANERALWLLKRIPAQAFSGARSTLSREHWEQWLRWTGESGMW